MRTERRKACRMVNRPARCDGTDNSQHAPLGRTALYPAPLTKHEDLEDQKTPAHPHERERPSLATTLVRSICEDSISLSYTVHPLTS